MTVVVREIEFENNPLKVCYSGQLLQGKVKIYFPTPTHLSEIYITFLGQGCYEWLEHHTNRTVTVVGTAKYFDEKIDIIRNSNVDVILPAGNNNYPFEVQLPNSLPTSYEGTYGYIRYVAVLYIVRSATTRYPIEPLNETFTIIKPLNLSNGNMYRRPIEELKVVQFSRCCLLYWWKSDELKICGRLPVSGYCPGQIMNLKLDVINRSGQDILMFRIELIQEVTYNSTTGSKKIELITLKGGATSGCQSNRSGIQTVKMNILVPTVPATGFQSVSTCVFNYYIQITAVTSCCHYNPTFHLPVVVGTYPVSDEDYLASAASTSMLVTSLIAGSRHILNSDDVPDSSDVPPYPDADPPTYEEAIRTELSAGNNQFCPKYPVYRRTTSYSSNAVD